LASVVASVKSLTFAKAFAAGRDQSQPRCWPIHKVRVSPGCREPSGLCPRGGGDRGRASPFGRAGSRRRQVGAPSFSPAVPLACHKQRSPAVRSGQSRSLAEDGWAGRTSLTWGGGGGRNCMACKGSGVQIPSAPPQVNGPIRLRPPRNRSPRAANRQQSASARPIWSSGAAVTRPVPSVSSPGRPGPH
jgi:hypothetical protein